MNLPFPVDSFPSFFALYGLLCVFLGKTSLSPASVTLDFRLVSEESRRLDLSLLFLAQARPGYASAAVPTVASDPEFSFLVFLPAQ